MAYVSQEKKSKIAAALKPIIPAGWRYSLAVHNHSTIVLTIREAPVNIIAAMRGSDYFDPQTAKEARPNVYHIRRAFADEQMADLFERIVAALNIDNHDNSDPMTDYFDVGHYKEINIGKWNKPFVCTAETVAA